MENVGYYAANDFKGWYLPPFTFSTLKASAKKYDNVRNPLNMMQGGGMQQSPDGLSLDSGGYQQPLYLQQEHSMQPINVR
ncbi:hypothetical protein G9C98_005967 [Cotesia typhae]|uniref:Uncharacterized protein n=1 Tax=Cotesia typhae TaxID=2053667 RepID=A0A8J5UYM1_9HYME|nr:hypothetical protein G9C98_005967 [Cotesia typhae]